MIHKVYWCRDCSTATTDETVCIVCNKNQQEIGWYETTETGDKK